TDDLKRSLGLRNESGNLAISQVAANSSASEAGLRRLDIIREVNGQEVKTLREFYSIVTEQADDDLVFRIGRQGHEVVIGIVR
ncbi:MAG: PDZ domain-containing protein, partial [Spirochaetales bacterium]